MRSAAVDRRLEAIAGPPLAMLTVPDTASSPLDIGPTEARTLYAVGSTTATAGVVPLANLGAATNGINGEAGAQILRSSIAGLGGLEHRGQVIGGTPTFLLIGPGWPWNMPLSACGWWDGNRFGSQGYRSAPTVSAPSAGGSMNATPRLRMAPMSSVTPIAALAYRGVHDLATRTRILNWLMQRYGSL